MANRTKRFSGRSWAEASAGKEDWITSPSHDQPLPASGERVTMVPAGSTFRKAEEVEEGSPWHLGEQAAARRRADWEASPEGQARTTDIVAMMKSQHGITATAGQIYDDFRRRGYISRQTGPTHYDVQLPGMADPHAAPRPPKWEELPAAVQQHTLQHLALHGTSIEQMTADFGAQYDQGIARGLSQGYDTPYAQTFYSTGEPRQRIRESAADLGLPQLVHAQINAFTSPNTKFKQDLKSGETVYPNDVAARHAAIHAMEGRDPSLLRDVPESRELRHSGQAGRDDPRRVQGYPANLEKAAQAIHQYQRGVMPADWRTGKGAGPMGENYGVDEKGKEYPLGKSPWAESFKTGPYANSWSDTHPQYFVSDIHSGGGGMLPHESSFKGTEGKKSQREESIDTIPYFHAVADYSARMAMLQRGLPSVRETQAGQWGEEQLQRGEEATRMGWPSAESNFPTPSSAYPERNPRPVQGPGETPVESRIGHQPALFNEDFTPSQSLVPPRYGVNAMGTRRTRRR